MRVIFTICLFSLLPFALFAQPINDDCGDADFLTLSSLSGCDPQQNATDNFSFDNIDATPITPFPGCDGQTIPVNEVWFSFEATGNLTTVSVTSNTMGISLYGFESTNGSCGFLIPLGCSVNQATTSLDLITEPGVTYFLAVGGGIDGDFGNFDMEIESTWNCENCISDFDVVLNPPPVNGTYSSGQTIEVCVTIDEWDPSGGSEWLHAITFDFGPAWDINSVIPDPPPSCDGQGSWDWYESWESCASGETFGPGFAYDSALGIDNDANCNTGGSPGDGDPGNNWGDGAGGCDVIPNGNTPALTFCFLITINDCPPSFTGEQLDIVSAVYTDGQSGSWVNDICNSGPDGTSFPIFLSTTCCNDIEPLLNGNDVSCAGGDDGSIEIEGNGGFDPSEVFNFTVLDDNNNIIWECMGCSGLVITPEILAAGNYTVVATNLASNCTRSEFIEIFDGPIIQASIDEFPLNPCPGEDVELSGTVDTPGSTEIYNWSGPGTILGSGPIVTVTEPGTYTLVVEVDGCPSEPASVDVEFVDFEVMIIGEPEACADTEFTLEATDGIAWDWVDITNNQNLSSDQSFTTILPAGDYTIELTATDPNGCEAVETFDLTVHPLPEIEIIVDGTGCANSETILTASGAGNNAEYEWADDAGASNPRILFNEPVGFNTYEVFGTDENGCVGLGSIDIEIVPPPEITFELSDDEVCPGEEVTITVVSTEPISAIDWNGAAPNNQNPITITIDEFTIVEADVTSVDGCLSEDNEVSIGIEDAPEPPTISCGTATATSVEFMWTDVIGADEYEITINGVDQGVVFGPFFTATGFSSNTAVTITVQALGADICPVEIATFTCNTLSCPPFQLDIDDVAPICLTGSTPNIFLTYTSESNAGTITWEPASLVNPTTGEFSPTAAGVGSHDITIRYSDDPCEYTDVTTIVINQTPNSNFSISSPGPICINSDVTVTYTGNATPGATYTWDFGGGTATPGTGPGPHTVSWPTGGTKTITLSVSENGCSSTQSSQSISVVNPIATPIVTCGTATTSSVTFNWSPVAGATSYTVTDVTGPAGTLAGETYTVTGLNPGQVVTITVTANTNNVCGPTTSAEVSCAANACPNFNINITPVPDICLTGSNAPITLMATASGGVGGGTFSWSGPNVVGDQFTPTTAGPQVITVTYTEDNCSDTQDITIDVFDTPTAAFTIAPAPVCTDQTTTITYTGTASPAANYTWNFAGGTAVPGTGPGPHTVSWPTGGVKNVSLTVSENGCTSSTVTQMITVEEPLAVPVINCSPNTTQIVFSWNDIAGATGYMVNLISAPGGAMTSLDEMNRTFTVTGLMAGDVVEIEVVAVGTGPCGNSSNTFMCQAQDCPAITVDIDAVAPICFETGLPSFPLTATVAGGDGDGVFTWAGDGITDAAAGTFSPVDAGVGPAAVTVSYREDGCDYVDDIVIQIFAIPTADFTANAPICVTDSTTVLYTGSGSDMANYNWDFDGGTAVPGTGPGPHRVIWDTDGDKTISLTVTENGCTSEAFTQTVMVAPELIAPMISCDVTSDSIIFTWPDVAGATGYTVTIIDAPANAFATGGDPANTFIMAGFTPGQPATIAVTAISGTACPDITFQGTCELENCPDITIEITDVADICLDNTAAAFDLVATLTGNTTGILTWMGTGITDPMVGTFDPLATGPGTFNVIATYEEMSCFYTDTTTIVVNAQPSASFTASGPICEDDISIVTYTGDGSAMATYDWNFGTGTVVNGTDAGPYEISWADGGNQTITLTVTENGCASDPFSTTVEVVDSLVAPVISCASTNTSITFSWNAVAGATGYQVNVIDAPAGATETADLANRMYTFSDLAPEDQVTIEVVVLTDNICGGVSSTQTCMSDPCSERTFGTAGYGPFCEDEGVQMLIPVITGGNLTGTITWSGDGITSTNGMFDPAMANIGNNLVTLSYEQTGCFYDTTYTVVVNAKPIADFSVISPVCVDDPTTITFTGTAGAMATYDWSFDGGTIVSGSGVGPYEVSWDTPGDKNISLTVTENGCVSDPTTGTVTVDAEIPQVTISCTDATTSSVTFSWDPVAGADDYTVVVTTGQTGTQDGNTFTVTNLTDGEVVSIEVTASGTSVCGSSVAQGTCNALSCEPLSITLDGPGVICEGDDTALTINITGGQGTPVTIDYTINGATAQLTGITDGDQISLTNVTEESTIVIVQVSDEVNTNCIYSPATEFVLAVDPQVSAGLDGLIDPVCPDDATVVDLNAALQGAGAGGSWTETSTTPSTGGAFQAGAGTFNAQGQASNTYTFTYTVDGGACPDDSAEVSFTINNEPVADAGLDQTLTCNMGAVALGGNSTSGATYSWTSDNPDAMITNPDGALVDVSAPGTYTIEVTNAEGCVATDQVVVSSDFDVPVADISISEVSCFQAADGAIIINTVAGGTPPYSYSLNGSTPTTNTFFGNLDGSMYNLLITDANGCFTELEIELIEPTEVAVSLTTSLENEGNEINLGDPITLQALYDPNIPIDTIIWQPDTVAVGLQDAVTVSPTETTTYSVTITDINGCSDSDNLTVIVRRQRPVYVPNAFSPDNDDTNDFLFPQGGGEIVEIKSFLVFNRWGETVFERYNFQPNDPSLGWDGRFRGQMMNAAVFVYYLEVEFIDGETELFKGDVMLMR